MTLGVTTRDSHMCKKLIPAGANASFGDVTAIVIVAKTEILQEL
jgi:hypothetical protein